MKQKNRNAWILPHCLSLHDTVDIVEFDAAALIGGIINPANESNLPADLTDRDAMKNSGHHTWGKQIEKIIKVNNKNEKSSCKYMTNCMSLTKPFHQA